MAATQTELPFSASFFRRLQQLRIHTRRSFLGSRQGQHLSQRKGHGLEFAEYRAYAPGDDFRYIDWGVLGRTDRIYVKEFREEQDLNVMVVLDCSASMGQGVDGVSEEGGEQKFRFAQQIALALSYVALTDGDCVTVSLLGQKNSPRFSGHKALKLAANAIFEARPGGDFVLESELRAAISRLRLPGKCFFISDMLCDLETLFAGLNILRYKNFEVALIQVLSPSELRLNLEGSLLAVDAESGEEFELTLSADSAREYALLLSQHLTAIERYARRYGISYILLSTEEDLGEVVLTKFPRAGLLR